MSSLEVLVSCFNFPLLLALHHHLPYRCLSHVLTKPHVLAFDSNWNLSFFSLQGLYFSIPHVKLSKVLFQQCTILMALVELGCKSSLGLPLILALLLSPDLPVGSGLLKSDQLSAAFILWLCPQHLLQICLTQKGPSFLCFVQNQGWLLHTFKATVQDKCKLCSVLNRDRLASLQQLFQRGGSLPAAMERPQHGSAGCLCWRSPGTS